MEDQKKKWVAPASRQGRIHITAHCDPHLVKQIRHLAVEHGITIQALLEEALTDILKKYKDN